MVSSGWAGLGRALAHHVACCGAATSRPWASTGLWSSTVGVSVAHGGPRGAGPWTTYRSTVSESTLHLSGVVHVHRVHACVAGEGSLPCCLAGVFPSATCSPASCCNGSGVQLRWRKASPCHGDCNGGVRTTDGASYVIGHGERRLELNRHAGVARVQRHRPGLWCA